MKSAQAGIAEDVASAVARLPSLANVGDPTRAPYRT